MVELKLAFASKDAAKYSVEHWHHFKTIPPGRNTYIGVWEDSDFKGVIIFGRSACRCLCSSFGLEQNECCELRRMAVTTHATPVSRLISIGIKLLRKDSPNLRLILSYAAPDELHTGVSYKASGWKYVGRVPDVPRYYYRGKTYHPRLWSAYRKKHEVNKAEVKTLWTPGYYRYALPLDAEMKEKIDKLAKPYPTDEDTWNIIQKGTQANKKVKNKRI
jgi:hypothetical protein